MDDAPSTASSSLTDDRSTNQNKRIRPNEPSFLLDSIQLQTSFAQRLEKNREYNLQRISSEDSSDSEEI